DRILVIGLITRYVVGLKEIQSQVLKIPNDFSRGGIELSGIAGHVGQLDVEETKRAGNQVQGRLDDSSVTVIRRTRPGIVEVLTLQQVLYDGLYLIVACDESIGHLGYDRILNSDARFRRVGRVNVKAVDLSADVTGCLRV